MRTALHSFAASNLIRLISLDGILYHNDMHDVRGTDAIIVQPTRKTSKYSSLQEPISLFAFLNEMGITLESL